MLLLARERMGQHRVLSLAGDSPGAWLAMVAHPTPAWGLGPKTDFPPGLYAPVVLTIEGNDVGK